MLKKTVESFSDQKKQQMKEAIEAMRPSRHMQWSIDELEALIARMEAAENIINNGLASNGFMDLYLIEAWRKAAGKEGR